MLKSVREFTDSFLEAIKHKPIRILAHFDTDGIASASILVKTFQRLDKPFTLRIIKTLDEHIIKEELARQPKEVLVFANLASGNLDYFKNLNGPLFIFDNQTIDTTKLNSNIIITNPRLTANPEENSCTASGLCYLFSKNISVNNQDLASIAIVGIIANKQENNLSKINQHIFSDAKDLTIKKGLIIYPATRPLKRALESSLWPYIPGVTGNANGVAQLLKETKIPETKSLIDLDEEEMSRLITAIMIRRANTRNVDEIIGNLYLLKFINSKEDVREISVLINACSKLGYGDIALAYCLGSQKAKVRALDIYNEYRQELVSGIKVVERANKTEGKGFIILNAKDQIKDAIVGTVCSLLSTSPTYEEGTILIGMAYNQDKIKVSARIVGKKGKNIKELLGRAVSAFRSEHPDSAIEFGGHEQAAGCLVERRKEQEFIETLKKNLEIELIKI